MTSHPDPPNSNPGVADDYLWLAGFGADDDDDTATYWGTSYTGLFQVQRASTAPCLLAVQYREVNASSQNLEARVFKDVFPRFRTMRGYHVARKAGWDCHGLPVELAVEKELGFNGKKDIEAYGIAEFNAKCRESVTRHTDAFAELTTRMGYWVDLDDAVPHDGPRRTSSRCGGR